MARPKTDKTTRIKQLENGAASADGLNVTFEIVTMDGKSHPFWMAADDIQKFISHIVSLSQHAAGTSGKLKFPRDRELVKTFPIDAFALSAAPGRSETEAMLGVHLGTFWLTFAVSTNIIQQLRVHLATIPHPTEPRESH